MIDKLTLRDWCKRETLVPYDMVFSKRADVDDDWDGMLWRLNPHTAVYPIHIITQDDQLMCQIQHPIEISKEYFCHDALLYDTTKFLTSPNYLAYHFSSVTFKNNNYVVGFIVSGHYLDAHTYLPDVHYNGDAEC